MNKYVRMLCIFLIGITLGAVTSFAKEYLINQITYRNTTVLAALNDLYSKVGQNTTGFCRVLSGDKDTVGSKYYCNLGDGVTRELYVLKVDSTYDTLIFAQAVNTNRYNWNTASTFFNEGGAGYQLAESWTNVHSIDLPDAQDIANNVDYGTWNVNTVSSGWWYLGTHTTTNDPTLNNQYAWLFDYTDYCKTYGCNYEAKGSNGYLTKNVIYNNSSNVWVINNARMISAGKSETYYQIRPVVTIARDNL